MNLYIDKTNLLSFIKSREEDLYPDCLKLMKKQLNIYFNFSKAELKDEPLLMTWVSTLSQGVEGEIAFDYSFPARPLKSNTANGFNIGQLTSVYLVDDNDAQKLKNAGSILIGTPGEELQVFNSLFFNSNDYDFERKWRIGGENFKGWQDLAGYSMPLTDVLIIDPYVLKSQDILTPNILSYLQVMAGRSHVKANIVIVTHPDNYNVDENSIRQVIAGAVEPICGKKPNVTIVKSSWEHDRTVITNYKRIYSGDTLNFWDSTGKKITKGKELHYCSLAKLENHKLALEAIEDVQKAVEFLEDNNPHFIIGDKKSGFLKFKD